MRSKTLEVAVEKEVDPTTSTTVGEEKKDK